MNQSRDSKANPPHPPTPRPARRFPCGQSLPRDGGPHAKASLTPTGEASRRRPEAVAAAQSTRLGGPAWGKKGLTFPRLGSPHRSPWLPGKIMFVGRWGRGLEPSADVVGSPLPASPDPQSPSQSAYHGPRHLTNVYGVCSLCQMLFQLWEGNCELNRESVGANVLVGTRACVSVCLCDGGLETDNKAMRGQLQMAL